ncbi:class I mannose-6-phosphate isomerase [Pedobacter sandarakinus]|uniref:class I mannose-6-phosphate isomerase n=1 Tax=Pedobacter sandarakinus TaxID=353156 RepID=UPI0022468009|nr:class I mannose-6-phosphate isomerase [Pedobacter sandarakinus]MCX2574153.1 class I mannose-6-phosphate isomerase [Pedobacter sandarakinus]
MSIEEPMRKTEQEVMPNNTQSIASPDGYDIYPYFSLGDKAIFSGYDSLCDYIVEQKTVVIDGYIGVYWNRFSTALKDRLQARGLRLNIVDAASCLLEEEQIDDLVKPFLGERDAVWGTKTSLTLSDFFNLDALTAKQIDQSADINIIIGCGSSLSNWDAKIIYVDLPKNELQHRMSAGAICNLGKTQPDVPTEMYKQYYFVDWVVLNEHKKGLVNEISVFVDAQWEEEISWSTGAKIRAGLQAMSTSVFRARPWFAPGAWGGQWMKNHMPQLDRNEVNYAWSFELIVPENGLVFESNGVLLEVSFDLLMFTQRDNVMGEHAQTYGDEFPIRFDFLDTFDGGNLSIQCHPTLNYIRKNFGEQITQDETYYILDCKDDATVYLGFQDDINPSDFREALEKSNATSEAIDIEKYVQVHTAKKHDLFLIPNGTVHSAGAQNLVLEISATPYIFTFKMYDWVRLDLNGQPRPINIEHAFNNLDFSRKGQKVVDELISKPYVLSTEGDMTCYHLPTHQDHFYDVHRVEFDTEVEIATDGLCHVLMLVEGESIIVSAADGREMHFAFAETFVVPSAAKHYKIVNKGKQRAKVIKAFLK